MSEPRTTVKVAAWVRERWPVDALLSALLDERIRGGARYVYSLGSRCW